MYLRPRVRIHDEEEEEEANNQVSCPKKDKKSIALFLLTEGGKQSSNGPERAPSKGVSISKVSSVQRPRAVLSSPDNDGLIGNRNKLENRRCSSVTVKKLNLIDDDQKTMAVRTVPIIRSPLKARIPVPTARKDYKDSVDVKRSGLAGEKSSKGIKRNS